MPEVIKRRPRIDDVGIRERSGEVDSDDVLVAFLYTLARDHVTTGDLEKITKDLLRDCTVDPDNYGMTFRFSNGWLAQWAKDMAKRLKEG